jgi:REP element-mobilizing transposase RayT
MTDIDDKSKNQRGVTDIDDKSKNQRGVTDIDANSKNQRGGKREGAGRKKTGRCKDAPHRSRPALSNRHPVHIVYRITGVCELRRGEIYAVFRRVLVHYLGLADFRIVHISIQTNHLHMLVEAADAKALTEHMKSFATRAARALNKRQGSCGNVFAYRYYASQIKTARYARHALAYVLNNWRRHRQDWEHAAARAAKLDPYSSAVSFDGWTMTFGPAKNYAPLPVSPPKTTLLRDDWRLYGLIDPWEVPGPLWK